MATSSVNILNFILKTIVDKSIKLDSINFTSNLLGLGILSGAHFTYSIFTDNKEEIIIDNKYKMVRNGFTNFMIIDNKGRHFNINNSLWYWKWDSLEDWSSIKNGDKISVRYYGWRVPIFGLFPNIVKSRSKCSCS